MDIVCPKCSELFIVKIISPAPPHVHSYLYLVCSGCGLEHTQTIVARKGD